MSLRDYVIQTRTIPTGNGHAFTVRALGFDDILHLLVERHGLVETGLSLFGESGFNPANAEAEEVRAFALQLMSKTPELVAELIACAADEPDMAPTALRLPAPVQLEAFMAAYELTFTEPGALGKFFGRLTNLMTSIPRPMVTAAEPDKSPMGGPVQPGSNASGAM
jgi:hypothetical protein